MDQERFNRAMMLADNGELEEAADLLRQEVLGAEDPAEKGAAILCENSVLLRLGRLEQVQEGLRLAEGLIPAADAGRMVLDYQDSEVDLKLGNTRGALHKLQRMENRYAAVLKLPEYENIRKSSLIRRGKLLVGAKRVKEAVLLLERALALESEEKNAEFYCSLAICYFHLDRFREAEEQLQNALERGLPPVWEVKAREYLGAVYFKRQAYALAKTELLWCLNHSEHPEPIRKEILKNLAITARLLNAPDEAAEYERMAGRE